MKPNLHKSRFVERISTMRTAGNAAPSAPQRQTTIGYDAATGRIATMLANGSNVPFTWSYLPGSDLKSSLAYPNDLTASWTYDANSQLLQVRNATSTDVISQYDYTYDAAGRRINVSKTETVFDHDDSIAYDYNTRSELTNAVAAVDSAYRYAYDFDDIGNRESANERGTNAVYMANQLNQYAAVDDFTPQYDLDGNQTLVRTSTGIWQVSYNGENRPVGWTCGTMNIVMSFDRMGRRAEYLETVDGGAAASTNRHHRFVYDGYLCVQRLDASAGNAVDLVFGWDAFEKVAAKPLMVEKPGSYKMHVTHDGNKNVSELVFFSGGSGIAAHYEYAPFGAVTASTRSTSVTAYDFRTYNPFRFSSEYADDTLGLVYYNYRHYNPLDGRWCCKDYVSLGSGGKYAFLNNRFSSTDRLGLYDELVHFYFIYGYLREHGWSPNDAREAAYGSEYPDTGKWSAMPDGMTVNIITHGAFGIETFEWKLNDATFHNFNGLSKDGIKDYRECIKKAISTLHSRKCPFGVGLLLHALGDTYAHVQVSGNAYENCNRLGHTLDGFSPDDVQAMSVILDDKPDPFDCNGRPVINGCPAIKGYLPTGQIQFTGFVNDLESLQLGSSYNHKTSYSKASLMGDLYARSAWWQQFYLGDYKYSAKDKLRKYGLQFEKLDFLKGKTVDKHISSLPDRSCRDTEANSVREILRQCLRTAGWKGIE